MGDAEPEVVPAVESTADAIAAMEIRGAATIADAAAAALATQAEGSPAETPAAFRRGLRAAARTLYETRPTAVSLPNALRYVLRGVDGDTVAELRASTIDRAASFRRDLEHARETLGGIGANRLRDGDVVLTHCHSTDALACVEAALEDGKSLEAIVKETRPRKQGHITATQLREWGVPVTLIVDGAARRYLDAADHVLVGADSIAADGSVINKIGTSGLAVVARERGVPVMVAAQTIKLHPDTLTGHTVAIETRDEREVLSDEERASIRSSDAPDGSVGEPGSEDGLTVENPAFDVTPPRYVDAIVTERGQFPPESIVTLMRELFGDTTDEPWAE
ncbi:translation initiation factor IF-2B subunit delta [Natrinema pellirubrum DSM 15624]|uniref:Ribose 1,5-bisphosphate isomerase n=1 Tax=Natrinema pellirubrum (strain DSM 15624 / CIP 106293 / JCM 10476 / NCIMB 786 / 157) TaxID=797303 RepID=L0JP05_NATP1|nr:ribose 1,5-bisphosphate isomerase [Natrinema pellirubrum]AGB33265.1 ribose-1,5-bisphosphate isomerase, e2b2 family [Natrinema pellirubrum DSM 15624]ELY71630.1 translation initiation factor IF-2B subunit delta [Natrinema pellirubrum DSM 15624]